MAKVRRTHKAPKYLNISAEGQYIANIDEENDKLARQKKKKPWMPEDWKDWDDKDHDMVVYYCKYYKPSHETYYDDDIGDGMTDHQDSLDRLLEDEWE